MNVREIGEEWQKLLMQISARSKKDVLSIMLGLGDGLVDKVPTV